MQEAPSDARIDHQKLASRKLGPNADPNHVGINRLARDILHLRQHLQSAEALVEEKDLERNVLQKALR